jgi:hypothetical protein
MTPSAVRAARTWEQARTLIGNEAERIGIAEDIAATVVADAPFERRQQQPATGRDERRERWEVPAAWLFQQCETPSRRVFPAKKVSGVGVRWALAFTSTKMP